MSTKNDIGKRLYVAAATPATNDTTGFEALSWTQAKYHQTLPQLGVTNAVNEVEDLESGFTRANKGAASGVETTINFRIEDTDRTDAGQAIVKTAAVDEDGLIAIKIVDGSGADNAPVTGDRVEYAQGFLHSFQPNQGTTTSHEGFAVSFKQNDFTVTGTEPA